MPRGEHLRKAWQLDPEGMKKKTQAALEKARAARTLKAEEVSSKTLSDLDRLWNWLDAREKEFQRRIKTWNTK